MSEYAKNKITGRLIKKSTALYKKLKKLGKVEEIDSDEPKPEPLTPEPEAIPEPEPEPEYNESTLQKKLASISTDMITSNMKKIVKAQKLSDSEMDIMLKKMLYKKLCIEPEEPKPKKKPKKKKQMIMSSDSESD